MRIKETVGTYRTKSTKATKDNKTHNTKNYKVKELGVKEKGELRLFLCKFGLLCSNIEISLFTEESLNYYEVYPGCTHSVCGSFYINPSQTIWILSMRVLVIGFVRSLFGEHHIVKVRVSIDHWRGFCSLIVLPRIKDASAIVINPSKREERINVWAIKFFIEED